MKKLPSPTNGASEVAKLAIGVAASLLPGAGVVAPIANFAIERRVNAARNFVIEELSRGNIKILTDKQIDALMPMGHKLSEAAKAGEYKHNLRLLAEILKNELQKDEPDPCGFARMANRISGLSLDEMKVIALIDASLSKLNKSSTDAPTQSTRPFVSAQQLASDPSNQGKYDRFLLEDFLNELAARGLLIPNGSMLAGKNEQYYYASRSFVELIENARSSLCAAAAPPT